MAKRRSIKIVILPTAKVDLDDIVSFIAKGSLRFARLEKQLIIKAIDQLHNQPELGKPFEHRSINARQLVFRNYLIIYRLKSEFLLEILTIHHHARLIGNNPAFKDTE
jgi:toxin ParE1/3/4